MKPICEWCGKKEYNIAILRHGKEELICSDCFRDMIKENYKAGLPNRAQCLDEVSN